MDKTSDVLYILGNGFDLAHNLPTSYESFHSWLENNGDKSFVRAFEKLYPNVKDDIGLWRDLESALGNVSLEHAIEFDWNYQECPDEFRCENSSHDSYRCGDNLRLVTKVLPSCFWEWALSIDLSNCEEVFKLCKDAYCFSFNYTRTLEDVYDMDLDKIHHIHGDIGNNKELVVGYGEALFEESHFESGYPEVNVELILNALRERRKPVSVIIQEPEFLKFMQSLSSVSSVVVYGHSCSKVDKPYFVEIAKYIKDNAHWTFYVHESDNNNFVKRYADSIRQENQLIEVTNESPIELCN